jgi:hypothetical protein
MNPYDNPAGRLHNFLVAVRDSVSMPIASFRDGDGYRQDTGFARLAYVFDIQGESIATVLEMVSHVFKLPSEIASEVTLNQNISPKFGSLMSQAETYLSSLAMSLAGNGLPSPTSELLLLLDLCSDQLAFNQPESSATPGSLKDFEVEIVELLADLEDSEINSELRDFLMIHLVDMLRGIKLFRVAGVDSVRSAIERTFGDLRIIASPTDFLDDSPAEKRIMQKFQGIMSGLGQVLIGGTGSALGTIVVQALNAGHPH